jgi:SAM-dependent methyltransferase
VVWREGHYDDRFGYPGQFRMRRCSACGHLHLDASFSPEQISALYTQYYPRRDFDIEKFEPHREVRGAGAWWNGARASAFRWVPPGVRVLDIGCGLGMTLAYHRGRGCEAFGVEADENVRRVAERYGLDVQVGLFDPARHPEAWFDFVTLDQVVEHAQAPVELLRGVRTVLKPGGIAVLATPNPESAGARLFGVRWPHWHTPYHLQFFTGSSMRIAAERAGLTLVSSRTVTSSEWLYYQWLHLASRPAPGTPSDFWTPGRPVRPAFRFLRRVFTLLHRLQLDHVVTRVLDAAGVGDNRLFTLRRPA